MKATVINGWQFQGWLQAMKERGLIRYEKEAARALNVSAFTLRHFKTVGIDRRTALACAALLHGIRPYGASDALEMADGVRELIKRVEATEARRLRTTAALGGTDAIR